MRSNVGTWDRVIRLAVAAIALTVAIVAGFGTVVGIIATVVAIVMVATAAVGFCPLYTALRINTCSLAAAPK